LATFLNETALYKNQVLPQDLFEKWGRMFLYKTRLYKTRRIVISPPICLLLISLIVSCASAPPPRGEFISPETTGQEIESSKQVKAMNEKILMSSLSLKRDPYSDYKIGPEDLLEISVFEVETLNKTVRVSSQGNISFPLLGVVRVKGLTANQLERELRDLLAEKYLQDPQVSVFIKEYRSQRISVMGAVEKPGVFEVTGQRTIVDMLAMGGGLKEDAGNTLFLIRPPLVKRYASKVEDSEGGSPRTFVVNLQELLVKGDLSLNLPIIHGDVINVPVSDKVFVGGEVWKPGGFFLKAKKMTLSQAIVLAGGVKPQAKGSQTRIFRYSETSPGREIITADIYAIQKGKKEDLYLKENDIIIVPKHGVKAILVGVKEILTGVFSVGYAL
jgi:polysaccharide export outer membrane protein